MPSASPVAMREVPCMSVCTGPLPCMRCQHLCHADDIVVRVYRRDILLSYRELAATPPSPMVLPRAGAAARLLHGFLFCMDHAGYTIGLYNVMASSSFVVATQDIPSGAHEKQELIEISSEEEGNAKDFARNQLVDVCAQERPKPHSANTCAHDILICAKARPTPHSANIGIQDAPIGATARPKFRSANTEAEATTTSVYIRSARKSKHVSFEGNRRSHCHQL